MSSAFEAAQRGLEASNLVCARDVWILLQDWSARHLSLKEQALLRACDILSENTTLAEACADCLPS